MQKQSPVLAKLVLKCMLALTLWAISAPAQVDTGMIAGRVRDPSGSVIPDAQITISNMATTASATTRTSDNGQFVAPVVNIGIYSVTVDKPGFQRFVQSGIKVGVQTRLELDITLQLGVMTQEVCVMADAPLLETQSANVGQVVSDRQLSDLPLNGRRYSDLAFLATGVNTVTLVMAARGEGVFSVDGNTSLQNNFVLDGLDNNSYDENLQSQSAQAVQSPVDAISEFKIQTHTYDVSFGRNAGSVVNVTLKSGTNQLHGAVYEFFRNRSLDATDFFLNSAGQSIPQYQRNQFGGAVGGPIKRDHTFFFASAEHTAVRQGTTLLSSVPTPLMRQFNFTELRTAPRDPLLPPLASFRGCITNSIVNPNCLDPVGAGIMALYPLPNTNRGLGGSPEASSGTTISPARSSRAILILQCSGSTPNFTSQIGCSGMLPSLI